MLSAAGNSSYATGYICALQMVIFVVYGYTNGFTRSTGYTMYTWLYLQY